jgi:hypothetical protein
MDYLGVLRCAIFGALFVGVSGCQSTAGLSGAMDAQNRACQASGGVLTGMGCQHSGAGESAPGPQPTPEMKCKTSETTVNNADGSTTTDSKQFCSSF